MSTTRLLHTARHLFRGVKIPTLRHIPLLQRPLSSLVIRDIKPHATSTRFFATDADILKAHKKSQVVRTSVYEPNASKLIEAIRSKDYKNAEILVLQQGVNVNGHNRGENTPLTDCAMRGDSEGTKFLLTKLKANPSASCDCPDHKTALHYASEYGHLETVKVLIQHGANPTLKTSSNRKAIEMASTPLLEAYLQKQERVFVERTGLTSSSAPLKKYLPNR